MESDDKYQPISTRFDKFTLTASSEVRELEEFKTLQSDTDDIMSQLRKSLRAQVIKCAKLEAANFLESLQKFLVDCISDTVAIFCTANEIEEDLCFAICNKLIEVSGDAIGKEFSLTSFSLLSLFQTEKTSANMNMELPDDAKDVITDASQAIIKAFVNPWEIYIAQEKTNTRTIKINKRAKLLLTAKATKDAELILDSKEPVSRETLDELVAKRTATEVKRQIDALKASLKDDGGKKPSAQAKKKKGNEKRKGKEKADASRKDTDPVSQGKKKENSKKKGENKSSTSKKKRKHRSASRKRSNKSARVCR